MSRRAFVLALLLASCRDESGVQETPTGSTGEQPDPGPLRLAFEEIGVQGGLAMATELRFLPTPPDAEPELLVLSKDGTVVHLRLQGDTAQRLGTFSVPGVHSDLDCGLLSLAIDPAFEDNGFIYAGLCESQFDSAIVRLTFTPQDYAAIPGSAVEIMVAGDPAADRPWHNIGSIGFDETGAMWALFGDKRVTANGQDVGNDLSAVVRIIPSRGPQGGHEAAPDNPFVDVEGADPDVFAYGLRSPWRGALDSAGRLWIGDVGANGVEEIDLLDMPGQNFGWAAHEGPCDADCDGLVDPVTSWHHDEVTQYMLDDPDVRNTNGRVAWVGVEHVPGQSDPYAGRLAGKMLFGDFCLGYVRALQVDEQGGTLADEHLGHLAHASSWDQGPDGYLYATTFGSCETVKLDPADPPPSGLWRAIVQP